MITQELLLFKTTDHDKIKDTESFHYNTEVIVTTFRTVAVLKLGQEGAGQRLGRILCRATAWRVQTKTPNCDSSSVYI